MAPAALRCSTPARDLVRSKNRLLTTIAYRLDGETTYALEGAIFIAGAAVQWLRDGLRIIRDGRRDRHAGGKAPIRRRRSIWCRPLSGWARRGGTPRRAAPIFGLTRNTGPAELARAALEVGGLPDARPARRHAQGLEGRSGTVLRVDGGMVASDWTMQFLADILDAPVDRPTILETTALGAAWLAGHKAGVWPDRTAFAERWALDRQFNPQMDKKTRKRKLKGWREAVKRTLS